jgi:DNA-binding response OmpR family regulator
MRVLLVEDEAKVSNFVARGLTAERRSAPNTNRQH